MKMVRFQTVSYTHLENLGIGLAMKGKKVLLVDTDPQASLTICLGHPVPDQLSPTLSDVMGKILLEQPIAPGEGILHHPEGVDLMPANIELSGLEVSLVNAMSRETILRQYLDTVKQNYDFILLDCMPSLGMLTVNALAAADNVLIPVQAAYLPAKGLEQLLQTINKVRRQINPKLKIEGILLTMVDSRTNYSKEISSLIRENYGGKLKVYKTDIPRSVRAEEISAEGTSIFKHDPKGKVADAYRVLTCLLYTSLEAEGGSGEEDTRYLTLSAVASSSGLFPYCVAIGEVLSELPELEVTVAESGGNVANAQELRAGEISIANSISNTDYESYTGTGATFEGDPFQDFRIDVYKRQHFQLARSERRSDQAARRARL